MDTTKLLPCISSAIRDGRMVKIKLKDFGLRRRVLPLDPRPVPAEASDVAG